MNFHVFTHLVVIELPPNMLVCADVDWATFAADEPKIVAVPDGDVAVNEPNEFVENKLCPAEKVKQFSYNHSSKIRFSFRIKSTYSLNYLQHLVCMY